MPTLQQLKTGGKSFILVLPKPLVKAKGWKRGDDIFVSIDRKTGDLILRKLEKSK